MFDKKIKISAEEFKKIVKDIETEVLKEQAQQLQDLKIKYFTLKESHEELEKSYIKVIQDNDILKAKIQESSRKESEETANTLSRYENLDKLLGADK